MAKQTQKAAEDVNKREENKVRGIVAQSINISRDNTELQVYDKMLTSGVYVCKQRGAAACERACVRERSKAQTCADMNGPGYCKSKWSRKLGM